MHRIFYSWQMNTPPETNRYLIRDSLIAAAKDLRRPAEIDEATRGVAGSPPIFATILSKIERCAVFVADLTLVTVAGDDGFCNPNVLVEYGYALAKRGDSQLVPVVNRSFGPIESLPFDLRHKAVRVVYDLPPDSLAEEARSVQRNLTGRLRSELRLILEDPRSVLNLDDAEVTVAKYLLERSTDGAGREYTSQEDIASVSGLEPSTVKSAVADLVSRGYAERLPVLGTDTPPVKPSSSLFWDLDSYFQEWDPRADARALADELVSNSETGHGRLSTRRFMEKSGWPLRRLNPALRFLIQSAIVKGSEIVVPDVVTLEIFETEATRSFLRGTYDPDRRRRT